MWRGIEKFSLDTDLEVQDWSSSGLARGLGMIVGIGIDLVANSVVQQELERGAWEAADGIFTSREVSRCGSDRRPALCYAACFAAKEATLKALGISTPDLGIMREIEIERQTNGAYRVGLHERTKREAKHLGARRVKLSVARSNTQTGAMVIFET